MFPAIVGLGWDSIERGDPSPYVPGTTYSTWDAEIDWRRTFGAQACVAACTYCLAAAIAGIRSIFMRRCRAGRMSLRFFLRGRRLDQHIRRALRRRRYVVQRRQLSRGTQEFVRRLVAPHPLAVQTQEATQRREDQQLQRLAADQQRIRDVRRRIVEQQRNAAVVYQAQQKRQERLELAGEQHRIASQRLLRRALAGVTLEHRQPEDQGRRRG